MNDFRMEKHKVTIYVPFQIEHYFRKPVKIQDVHIFIIIPLLNFKYN